MTLRSGAVSEPPPPELKPPPALYQGAVAAGTAKAKATWEKIFTLGIVSGCHIAFGAYLAITVGGACPGLAQTNPGLQKVRTIVHTCDVPLCHKRCSEPLVIKEFQKS